MEVERVGPPLKVVGRPEAGPLRLLVGTPGEADGPIAAAFAEALSGPTNIALSLRIRSGKSTALVRGLARWLEDRPGDTVGYFTYSRDMTFVHLRRRFGHEHVSTQDRIVSGGVRSSAPHGFISGVLVIDDAFKNREDFAANRQRAWDWVQETLLVRLTGTASVIVAQMPGWELVPKDAPGWRHCVARIPAPESGR